MLEKKKQKGKEDLEIFPQTFDPRAVTLKGGEASQPSQWKSNRVGSLKISTDHRVAFPPKRYRSKNDPKMPNKAQTHPNFC